MTNTVAVDRFVSERESQEGEQFWSDFTGRGIGVIKGHETITESALRATGLTAHRALLIEGVQRPDRAPSLPPGEQKRHALRGLPCQTTATALAEIHAQLLKLHGLALAARGGRDTWLWAGEALHLIQDSYSPAHTERALGGANPIIYIRSYRHGVLVGTTEHLYPVDHRDYIKFPSSKAWVARALSVSEEYLKLVKSHLARRLAPAAARPDLVRFMNRHLALSPAHRNPSDFHKACRKSATAPASSRTRP
jgi:hypothetical protein